MMCLKPAGLMPNSVDPDFSCRSRLISEGVQFDQCPYLLYVFGKTVLSKQCRPRSKATECGVSSGSTLFATHPAILNTFISSKIVLLKKMYKVKSKRCEYLG